MSRQRQLQGGSTRGGGGRATAVEALKDAGSTELGRLARTLGNDDLQAVMSESAAKRDSLLELVRQRLQAVQQLQMLEVHEIKNRKSWWRRVGHQEPGYTLPNAGRWKGPAQNYRQVVQALAQGHLGRAATLLQRAVEAERIAREAMPKQIKVPTAITRPVEVEEHATIGPGEGCPPISAPDALAIADRVIALGDRAEAEPVPRHMHPHTWWALPEEEDEKKKEAKDAKKADTATDASKASEAPAEAGKTPAEEAEKREEEERSKAEERAPARAEAQAPAKAEKPTSAKAEDPTGAKAGLPPRGGVSVKPQTTLANTEDPATTEARPRRRRDRG